MRSACGTQLWFLIHVDSSNCFKFGSRTYILWRSSLSKVLHSLYFLYSIWWLLWSIELFKAPLFFFACVTPYLQMYMPPSHHPSIYLKYWAIHSLKFILWNLRDGQVILFFIYILTAVLYRRIMSPVVSYRTNFIAPSYRLFMQTYKQWERGCTLVQLITFCMMMCLFHWFF